MKPLIKTRQDTKTRIQTLPYALGTASIFFFMGLQPAMSADEGSVDSAVTQSPTDSQDTTSGGETAGTGSTLPGAAPTEEQPAVSAPPAEEDGNAISSMNLKASDFIGAKVKNTNGDALGEISDLMINWPESKMNYAVLSYGGVAGIGAKYVAVPIDKFKAASQGAVLILDISKTRLEQAESFELESPPPAANAALFEATDDAAVVEDEDKNLLEKAADAISDPGK